MRLVCLAKRLESVLESPRDLREYIGTIERPNWRLGTRPSDELEEGNRNRSCRAQADVGDVLTDLACECALRRSRIVSHL